MAKIKICGLFNKADISYVNIAKPDYIGFVFANSKRKIELDTAISFKKELDKNIKSVGVFVNESIKNIEIILKNNVIDLIQLHGVEDENYLNELKSITDKKIIKAFSIKSDIDFKNAILYPSDYLLFDSQVAGSGNKFDWGLITTCPKKFFLAGGINITNISSALELKPYAIDLSSGVETNGIKDKNKILDITKKIDRSKYNE